MDVPALGSGDVVETLWSMDGWELCKVEYKKTKYNGKHVEYAATHNCRAHKGMYELAWLITDIETVCLGCGTVVPDEIQTLIQLLH